MGVTNENKIFFVFIPAEPLSTSEDFPGANYLSEPNPTPARDDGRKKKNLPWTSMGAACFELTFIVVGKYAFCLQEIDHKYLCR